MGKGLDEKWKTNIQYAALMETAKKFHIEPKEVKELIELSKEYMAAHLDEIVETKDLKGEYTRIQIPGIRGYMMYNRNLLFDNMRENGHISEEQWLTRVPKGILKNVARLKDWIKNYKLKVERDEHERKSRG